MSTCRHSSLISEDSSTRDSMSTMKRKFFEYKVLYYAFAFIAGILLVSQTSAQTLDNPDIPSAVESTPAPGFPDSQWLNVSDEGTDFLKGKVVLVNFWATWCPPCIQELPTIQALWDSKEREDFEVVAVNVGEPKEQVEEFLSEFGYVLEFPIVLDLDLEIYKLWKVRPVPTTYIVDRLNSIRYKGLGEFDFNSEKNRALIDNLIQALPGSG